MSTGGNWHLIFVFLWIIDSFVCLPGPPVIKLVVMEGSDAILPCSLGTSSIKEELFDWKRDRQEVFLYDKRDEYNNGRPGQDPQFKGRLCVEAAYTFNLWHFCFLSNCLCFIVCCPCETNKQINCWINTGKRVPSILLKFYMFPFH
uniref:Immunoglobulin V-set domain-containing protein n=1 Tax=Dicentrarchus labrax TaxID=13489 RepID=A0A8P4G8Z2_DICLA